MKEINPRLLGVTVMVDLGEKEGRDFERFDVYLVLEDGFRVDDPDGQIDQFEICRAIINSVSSEIGARAAHLKSYDNVSVSGLGVHHEIEIEENPGDFESLYGDFPKGFTPWRLSFYCLFAQWPVVEVRSECTEYPSELLIYAPEKIRKEYERDRWAKKFPGIPLETDEEIDEKEKEEPEKESLDPGQEGDEGEKPSFN